MKKIQVFSTSLLLGAVMTGCALFGGPAEDDILAVDSSPEDEIGFYDGDATEAEMFGEAPAGGDMLTELDEAESEAAGDSMLVADVEPELERPTAAKKAQKAQKAAKKGK